MIIHNNAPERPARRRPGRPRRALRPLAALAIAAGAAAQDRFEEAPIRYSESKPDNPAERLHAAIASGETVLARDPQYGYVKAALEALDVPVASQVLVFSKTSLQQRYIAPETPRAVYFNDDVYVGTVPGSDLIEISTADAGLGAVFYAFEQTPGRPPQIRRQNAECLQCHGSTLTGGYPGHVVRSVFADAQGFPILKAGSYVTTPASPFAQRWGGWYVTGTHGAMRHLGNALSAPTERGAALDVEAAANRLELDPRVPRDRYLSPHSDLVALMVLVHQAQVHNLLTQAGFETRFALADQAVIDDMLGQPGSPPSDSTQRRIANAGEKLIDGLLSVGEAPLDAPLRGSSGFAEGFAARGPRDAAGRSLRDFDLERRLFRYPLSYLIYSPQFDGLPGPMKDYLYRRLRDILDGADPSPRFAHLDAPARSAIRDILIATKSGLPPYWTAP